MNRQERRRDRKIRAKDGPPARSKDPRASASEVAALGRQAVALLQQNRLVDAEALCRRILSVDSDNADALHLLALVATRKEDPAQAADLLRRALRGRPDDPEALANLGAVLRRTGDGDGAIEAFRKAVAARPGDSRLHVGLGDALIADDARTGYAFIGPERRREAAAAFLRAGEIGPEKGRYHNVVGKLMLASMRHEDAIAALRRGIELEPQNAGFHVDLANALLQIGRFSEAAEVNRQALAMDSGMTAAFLSLANAGPTHITDGDVDEMQGILSRPSLARNHAIDLHFALGQVFDRGRRCDDAFRHFEAANRLMRVGSRYRVADDEALFARIKAAFTGDRIAAAAGGATSELPIFIVGMARSGTTLVEQILANHSRVQGLGEIAELTNVASAIDHRSGRSGGFPEVMADLGSGALGEFGQQYLDAVGDYAPDAPRVTDKMPGNFRLIGLIKMILPGARIVHCMRNPIATCFSCFVAPFAVKGFACDLADMGTYFRAYRDLMDHWRRVLPRNSVLDVNYEDLVTDPEAEAKRLLEFYGLSWEDGCLAFHQSRRAVKTASVAQVREKIYTTSIDRWRPSTRLAWTRGSKPSALILRDGSKGTRNASSVRRDRVRSGPPVRPSVVRASRRICRSGKISCCTPNALGSRARPPVSAFA